jgi:succinate dehydrogenase hydrophobic anchor subunit
MKEKLTIIIVLLFTIIVLIFAWFWLENVIEDYDIDRAMMENTFYQRTDIIQAPTGRNL